MIGLGTQGTLFFYLVAKQKETPSEREGDLKIKYKVNKVSKGILETLLSHYFSSFNILLHCTSFLDFFVRVLIASQNSALRGKHLWNAAL